MIGSSNKTTKESGMNQLQFLRQQDLGQRWGISPRTLEKWRWQGEGPRFVKIGGRIRYRIEDVEAWEAIHILSSTAEIRRSNAKLLPEGDACAHATPSGKGEKQMLIQHVGDGFIQDLPRDIALVFIKAKRAIAVEDMMPVVHKMKNKLDDKTISDMSNEIQSYFVVDSPFEVDAIRTEVAIIKAAVERLKQSQFVDKECADLAFEIWATVEDLIHDSSVDNMITREEEEIIKSDD